MNQFLSSSKSLFDKMAGTTPGKVVCYFYGGIVAIGFIRGAFSGCEQYYKWKTTRKQVSIGSDLYDPTINVVRDAGYWGFNTLQGGFGSAIIVATAPFSVPILIQMNKKSEQNNK